MTVALYARRKAVATGRDHHTAGALEDPRNRLRRVRDQGGHAGPDRARHRSERPLERDPARAAPGDRGAMPRAPHARLGDQYPKPAGLADTPSALRARDVRPAPSADALVSGAVGCASAGRAD